MFGDGFIPAHAGKTVGHRLQHQDRRAHPRSRGEKLYMPRVTFQTPGSSPLTRGKRGGLGGLGVGPGLIPAHAGKTFVRRCGDLGPGAHPRSRGENLSCRAGRRALGGSSPLTRGKPGPGLAVPTLDMAHPRSRGENVGALSGGGCVQGSSPLTRGKPCRTGNTRPCLGLIPAHAGKTTGEALPTESRAAHPRSRGENGQRFVRAIIGSGSSPLTRGKHSANR